VHLDLVARVRTVPGWAAWQQRAGTNDGHANTAVLLRSSLGLRDAGQRFLVDSADTRRRYVTWATLASGLTVAAAHLPPARDKADLPAALANLRRFARAHRRGGLVIGLDSNTDQHGPLEHATGLTWAGTGIDGFLTNLGQHGLHQLDRRYSDHHPLVTTLTS